MLRLKALGTMTEEEILAKVIGGKQRGHIAGRGRRVAGVGHRDVFSSGTLLKWFFLHYVSVEGYYR